jgi:hypothetical protein
LQKTIWEAVNLANLSKGGNAVAHTIDFQSDTNASKNNILTNASNTYQNTKLKQLASFLFTKQSNQYLVESKAQH